MYLSAESIAEKLLKQTNKNLDIFVTTGVPENKHLKAMQELAILAHAAQRLAIEQALDNDEAKAAVIQALEEIAVKMCGPFFCMKPEDLRILLAERIQAYHNAWATPHAQDPFFMIGETYAAFVGDPGQVSITRGSLWFSGQLDSAIAILNKIKPKVTLSDKKGRQG